MCVSIVALNCYRLSAYFRMVLTIVFGHKSHISLLSFRENLTYSCLHFRLDLWSPEKMSPHLRDLTDLTEMMDREGCCRSAAMHKSSPLGPTQQNLRRSTWGRTTEKERPTRTLSTRQDAKRKMLCSRTALPGWLRRRRRELRTMPRCCSSALSQLVRASVDLCVAGTQRRLVS